MSKQSFGQKGYYICLALATGSLILGAWSVHNKLACYVYFLGSGIGFGFLGAVFSLLFSSKYVSWHALVSIIIALESQLMLMYAKLVDIILALK